MVHLHSSQYYIDLTTKACDGCSMCSTLCPVAVELQNLDDFLDEVSLSFEDFIALLEWSEVSNEVMEEELFIKELMEIDYWAEKREELFPSIC